MLITHFTAFAPGKSGMYESTKDQIKYERKEGLDSQFIETFRPDFVGTDDFVETTDWRKAYDSDVWVVHAGIPPPLVDYLKDPKNFAKHVIVSILHGPCENMLLKEWLFMCKGIDEEGAFTITHINSIWNYDACVVLNQHEYDISVLFDEFDKLVYIPNSIDMDRIDTKAPSWNYRNRPAILSCDIPRIEKLPVHIIFAMPRILEKIPDARLNMYGLPFETIEFFRNLFHRSKKWALLKECCENVQMKTSTILPYIKGADIGFNSNYSGIMSRNHMEMMAMGVPVVSYNGDYTGYHAKIFDLQSIADNIIRCWQDLNETDLRQQTMEYALKNFDRSVYVKKYIELYQRLKEKKIA